MALDNRSLLAIFPISQYLNDATLRQAVVNLVKFSPDLEKVADKPSLLPFHPITMEMLKQMQNVDAYCVLVMQGSLIRTHLIITNGIARTNPPPEDYLCDSCHKKGWLKKEYQDSKLDGANIPVWLCAACSKLKPEERDVGF